MDDKRKDRKKKKGDEKKREDSDPVKAFADKVRLHKTMDSRFAVIGEDRLEYFRGKDFADVIRSNPDLVNPQVHALIENDVGTLEERLGDLLLIRNLIARCDRVNKTIRAGRKKLSKFPGRLEIHSEQIFTENDGFFAWRYERTRTVLQVVMSSLLPFLIILCCLFPVSPHWVKLSVLYFCLTLLSLIFGILYFRWLVFGLIWILVGKRVWFFPNILAEEATLAELIRFMPEPAKDEEPPPKLMSRVIAVVMTAATVWFCVSYAPDEDARAKYQEKASNIIDDILNFNPAMLVGKVGNATTLSPDLGSASNSQAKGDEEAEKESATERARKLVEQAEEALGEEDSSVDGGSAQSTTTERTGESVEAQDGSSKGGGDSSKSEKDEL